VTRGRRLSCAAVASALSVVALAPSARAADSGPRDTWSSFTNRGLSSEIVFGLRGGTTEGRSLDGAAGLSAAIFSVGSLPATVSVRILSIGQLGGGHGVEGRETLDLALGAKLGGDAGGFVRVGSRGFVHASDRMFLGALEPLQGQVGFQYADILSHGLLVEVALRGTLASGARAEVDDRSRRFGGTTGWGGHAAFAYGALRVETSFTQIAPTGASRAALDVVDAFACVTASSVALCGDHEEYFTGLFGPGGSYSREALWMNGMTFGVALR
jgi:hypothetical protein